MVMGGNFRDRQISSNTFHFTSSNFLISVWVETGFTHEFNTKSLRNFIEHVVDAELNDRLLPLLATSAATTTTVLDFQDILQRLAFDNICKIAFGYDPACLMPDAIFATAFDEAVMISTGRMRANHPLIWKLKRLLNIGSEQRLRRAVATVREFAEKLTREKISEMEKKSNFRRSTFSVFELRRDTTFAALTWFFWLLHKNTRIEIEILKEINQKSETSIYEEVKDMVYTHASLCESMRLYPPVAIDAKQAADDDVLPDNTLVKKGYLVTYHIYAMGRSEELWGADWAEFRPERWLEKDVLGRWVFKPREGYEYPVFQAGPRICLGKVMAFLQMKRVVAEKKETLVFIDPIPSFFLRSPIVPFFAPFLCRSLSPLSGFCTIFLPNLEPDPFGFWLFDVSYLVDPRVCLKVLRVINIPWITMR
ncbi:hypothetical protein L1987_29149 [Smallanthus sonchifolius]|uniref:Uncharacterized protein n=1 Tax=Smallanthus sonchifolius TaxID=185202 RepID=A0ACB9I0F0_9ASTR|nr:hypothetical protein L1987_29149 [Smallanthus sonchifolius]